MTIKTQEVAGHLFPRGLRFTALKGIRVRFEHTVVGGPFTSARIRMHSVFIHYA